MHMCEDDILNFRMHPVNSRPLHSFLGVRLRNQFALKALFYDQYFDHPRFLSLIVSLLLQRLEQLQIITHTPYLFF